MSKAKTMPADERHEPEKDDEHEPAAEDRLVCIGEIARQIGKEVVQINLLLHQRLLPQEQIPGKPGMCGIRKSVVNRFLEGTLWEGRVE